MNDFVIIADSTADLDKDLRTTYDIDYVKMNYVIDGVEYPASLDWENHSSSDFYNMMRSGTRITTTQVTRQEYAEKFTKYLELGKDILYISCSSALSGSINLAIVIAKELKVQYPERNIVCIDSLCSSLGQGYMLIRAAELKAEGKSLEEISAYIEENKLKVNQFGTVENLNYLKRAGRVTASSAFFGNMFGIKPIIISDIHGQNYAIEKVKGTANAKTRIAQHISEVTKNGDREYILISHADCLEDAHKLRDAIMEIAPFKKIIIGTIGPIVGSCVGPGTIISFCFGDEVTVSGGNK